jgi:xanthine/CO dehydrogenase XdhC/CoxF family maturation factor
MAAHSGEIRANRVDIEARTIRSARIRWEAGVITDVTDLGEPEPADGCLIPGFIDAHVHVESSRLTPARDQAALGALAGLKLGYLGVLGSPAKLRRIGVPGRVHAPMGQPIGSHTPEEIAVSVAAELLQTLRQARRAAVPTAEDVG